MSIQSGLRIGSTVAKGMLNFSEVEVMGVLYLNGYKVILWKPGH